MSFERSVVLAMLGIVECFALKVLSEKKMKMTCGNSSNLYKVRSITDVEIETVLMIRHPFPHGLHSSLCLSRQQTPTLRMCML